jgi:anaerobic ribonucleoside-triphosphate reductase activating protein
MPSGPRLARQRWKELLPVGQRAAIGMRRPCLYDSTSIMPHRFNDMEINLHAVIPRTRSNGPGLRMAFWFQGCNLACPGCFNPQTHPPIGYRRSSVAELVGMITEEANNIEGVTITGGEPLQQAPALEGLLKGIREKTHLSILLFSGYTKPEIDDIPSGRMILEYLDILIAGRFVQALRSSKEWRGSSNKTVHFLSSRYTPADFKHIPSAEVLIAPDGTVRVTGINPLTIVFPL